MTRKPGCWIGIGLVSAMLWPAAARAAPLQLQGELTITNRTDELDPSSALFNLSGGREFTLSVLGDPGGFDPLELLGETTLAPAFWAEPGETFTGPIAVDFLSPGAGLIEVEPIRVDGLVLEVLLFPDLSGINVRPISAVLQLERFNDPTLFDLGRESITLAGSGVFRVDAIVPEPSTGVILCLGVAAAVSLLSRQECLLEKRRKEILP